MEYSPRCLWLIAFVFALPAVLFLVGSVPAQGLPQSPYSAPSMVRSGLDFAPSNPLGVPSGVGPRGSDSIYLNSEMFQDILRLIPNLQVGYLYSFGKSVGAGRLTLDYLQPIRLGANSVVFGEAHGEFTDFWKTLPSIWRRVDSSIALMTTTETGRHGFNERADLSIGGGYRTLLDENTLLGVNAFFDSTKMGRSWYTSGGLGFEFAALLSGNDAIDLTFNWYGDLFSSKYLIHTFRFWSGDRYRNQDHINTFRRGPQNYDFQAGYSHELWNGGPDLRLSATGYRFGGLDAVYGTRVGTELKTRNGTFTMKYEASHDWLNGTYHEVGGFVNVGLRLSNLLNGDSPFVMPEPIFRSPRNLRKWLTDKVRRRWHAQAGELASRSGYTRYCVAIPPGGIINKGQIYPINPAFAPPFTNIKEWRMEWRGLTLPGFTITVYRVEFCMGGNILMGNTPSGPPCGVQCIDTETGTGEWRETTHWGNCTGSNRVRLSMNAAQLQFASDGYLCFSFRY